jgi:hypothetical protein
MGPLMFNILSGLIEAPTLLSVWLWPVLHLPFLGKAQREEGQLNYHLPNADLTAWSSLWVCPIVHFSNCLVWSGWQRLWACQRPFQIGKKHHLVTCYIKTLSWKSAHTHDDQGNSMTCIRQIFFRSVHKDVYFPLFWVSATSYVLNFQGQAFLWLHMPCFIRENKLQEGLKDCGSKRPGTWDLFSL